MARAHSTLHLMLGCVGFVLAARATLACGTILAEEPVEAEEGGSPDPASDSGLAPNEEAGPELSEPDGGTGDARPDAPPSCRTAVFDDFSGPAWTPVLWSAKAGSGSASVDTTSGGVSGDALRVSTTSSTGADFGYLMLEPTGDCGLAVDFQLRIQSGSPTSIGVFELISENRARMLWIEEQMGILKLVLKAEGNRTAQPPSSLQAAVFHHVVLRYEPTGAMSLTLDGSSVSLPPSATTERATRIRIGNLGAMESTSPGTGQVLRFDDVRVE